MIVLSHLFSCSSPAAGITLCAGVVHLKPDARLLAFGEGRSESGYDGTGNHTVQRRNAPEFVGPSETRSCYEYHAPPMGFDDAARHCLSTGGTLPRIDFAVTGQNMLRSFVARAMRHKRQSDGGDYGPLSATMVWSSGMVDGECVNFHPQAGVMPSHTARNSDPECSDSKLSFFCEYDEDARGNPVYDRCGGEGWVRYGDSCFKVR